MASDKKLILFLSSWYPTRIFPFQGDFVKRHAKAISLYQNVVCYHVIKDKTLSSKYQISESKDNNFHEVICYFNKKSFIRLNYLYYYLKGFKYVCKKFGKPDLIHGNILFPIGSIVFLFSVLYRIPYVLTEHWTGFLNNKYDQFPLIKRALFNYFGKKATCISPVTNNLKEAMIKSGIRANYKVIPNVVEVDIFKGFAAIKEERKVIIHVSNIRDEHKNISGLLRAISKLSELRHDFMLKIIHSEDNTMLKDMAESFNLTNKYVEFCGRKEYSEVAQMMSKSAFLVLFSNYENLPCVIVEAFASGIPVLSTDVGGINEHLDSKKGILIKKDDENALLDRMNYMLDHYQEYDKNLLREYAISNFSYKNIGIEYSQIYKSILNV